MLFPIGIGLDFSAPGFFPNRSSWSQEQSPTRSIPRPDPAAFQGYVIFAALTALVPSSALLPSARSVINWRAFSLAIFFVLLISLMWEATLAIPYGWWIYRDQQRLRIRITAWDDFPLKRSVSGWP